MRAAFFFSVVRRAPRSTLFPTRRSSDLDADGVAETNGDGEIEIPVVVEIAGSQATRRGSGPDRKSTRLNSSHLGISYAVFCLKKKLLNATQRRSTVF